MASIKKRLSAHKFRENYRFTGSVMMKGQRRKDIIFGAGGQQGGISVNPATSLAYYIRRGLISARHPRSPIRILYSDGTLKEEISYEDFVDRRKQKWSYGRRKSNDYGRNE